MFVCVCVCVPYPVQTRQGVCLPSRRVLECLCSAESLSLTPRTIPLHLRREGRYGFVGPFVFSVQWRGIIFLAIDREVITTLLPGRGEAKLV